MSEDELGPHVPAEEVFGDLKIAPLPEGTAMHSAFLLIKLDDGDWCARSIGAEYNRSEMLGQLVAYTHGLTVDEASGWFEDEDGPRT